MTTELTHTPPGPPHSGHRKEKYGSRIFFARLVLYWERLWPAMLPALAIISAIAIFSLVDIWRVTPGWLHVTVLILAGLAFAATCWRDIRTVKWPTRQIAQARLEHDGGVEHAALRALDDRPADPDQLDNPLWRAHMSASSERARKAKLTGMRDRITQRDPYGLRFMTAGLLAIAFIAAGSNWQTRLLATLSPGAHGGGTLIADVWIEPPAYTGAAPIYLLRAGEKKSGLQEQINAPQGALVVAQTNGKGRRTMILFGETSETRGDFVGDRRAQRGELTLTESGLLRIRMGSADIRWPVGVVPDSAPLVAFTTEPAASDQGLVEFSYVAQDDYAIAGGRLELRLDPDQDRPLDMPAFDDVSLSERRIVTLDGAAGRNGERSFSLDLQADPWAGLRVLATVRIRDGANQTGTTEEVGLDLPQRRFFNPLARSVLEQRQTLAVAPNNWRRAGRSLDAVTFAPETFFDQSTDYLLLRTAFWRVMRQDGEGFDDAIEDFWPLALQLEDDALELARQRLEAAEEALREAIERGASDEEIARLTEELRQAMNDYLAALSQSGQQQAGGGEGGQQIEQSNLDEMLDAIRDLAQSGAGNAARQMLSDLENILNNLRLSQGSGTGSGQGQGSSGESGASGQAGDLIGRQRELADDAFERGQNGLQPGENADDLADAERGLGEELDELIEELQGAGAEADPDGDAARAMGEARNAMRDAEQALRNGDFDGAAGAMERAIAQMREGAEGLAREEMRQASEGRNGERGQAGADPLGRPVGEAYGTGVEVPEESEAARTRAVIDALRQRLGEPGRSDDEVEYLERLLERF